MEKILKTGLENIEGISVLLYVWGYSDVGSGNSVCMGYSDVDSVN